MRVQHSVGSEGVCAAAERGRPGAAAKAAEVRTWVLASARMPLFRILATQTSERTCKAPSKRCCADARLEEGVKKLRRASRERRTATRECTRQSRLSSLPRRGYRASRLELPSNRWPAHLWQRRPWPGAGTPRRAGSVRTASDSAIPARERPPDRP